MGITQWLLLFFLLKEKGWPWLKFGPFFQGRGLKGKKVILKFFPLKGRKRKEGWFGRKFWAGE